MSIFQPGAPGFVAPKDMAQWSKPMQTRDVENRIIPRVAQVVPFYQVRPPVAVDLYQRAIGTLAAGAGSSLSFVFPARFYVLQQYVGVVQSLLLQVQAPTAALDVVFTLRLNRSPVPGWDNLEVPNVTANDIVFPVGGPLVVPGDSEMTVTAVNRAASGPWALGVQLAGWMWPRVAEVDAFGYASA